MSASHAPPPTWGLLLIKDPARSKTRLAGVLAENQRQLLAKRMFHHVLDQLLRTEGIVRVAVMSPQPPPLPEGVYWLKDTSPDLNRSVADCIRTLVEQGAPRVLVLPADLPYLSHVELTEFIGSGREYDMVIAPDEPESGTNALLLAAAAGFQPGFGVNSFSRHLEQARALGLKTKITKRRGLAFDLDDEQDWQKFLAGNPSLFCETI